MTDSDQGFELVLPSDAKIVGHSIAGSCLPELRHYLGHRARTSTTTRGEVELTIEDDRRPPWAPRVLAVGDRVEQFPGSWCRRQRDDGAARVVDEADSHGFEVHYAAGARLPARIEVVRWSPHAPAVESVVMRVYRDLLACELHGDGYVMLHAAVVSLNDHGRAFVGGKGAGKSPWLLRALAHGWRYVANDRVFVHPETGHVQTYPIAALVRPQTLLHAPQQLRDAIRGDRILRRDHRLAGYDKVGLTPHELALAFGDIAEPTTTLTELTILERVDPDTATSCRRVAPGSRERDLLRENVYYPNDPTYAFDVLCTPRPRERDPDLLVRALLRTCRTTRMRCGWNVFDREFDSATALGH